MKNRNYFTLKIFIVAIFTLFLITSCIQKPMVQNRPTTLIIKLDKDYSGNYIGIIEARNDSANNRLYRSQFTYGLFDYCYNQTISYWSCKEDDTGKLLEQCYCSLGLGYNKENCSSSDKEVCMEGAQKLSNGYLALKVPNSEDLVKNFVIFHKSIIAKSWSGEPGNGDSINMPHDELYSYVIEEHPLKEAYFCDPQKAITIPCPELGPNAEIEEVQKQCYKSNPLDLDRISVDLSQGKLPEGCQKII